MNIPVTLSRYIGRHFLLAMLSAAVALTAVALLIDMVELIRRAADKDAVPTRVILQMALLKTPNMLEKLLPFGVLIGSLLAFMRLTRSQELVVARSAGVSVWQFMLPAVAVALGLGILMTTVFNPLSSVLLLKFEKVEGRYLTGKPSLLSVSPSGLWLRQVEQPDLPGARPDVSEHIIYAQRISQGDMMFSDVIVFAFDRQGRFLERLDAKRAALTSGLLTLHEVARSLPGKPPELMLQVALPTTLQMAHIQDSFASPETIAFWKLPSFIHVLEEAGFSALRHRLYWHTLLATPFLYAGMVLLAALFSLRLPRLGRVGQLAGAGLGTGFVFYFLTDLVNTLGMAGTLPVALAAWAPAGIILMLGAGTLLHLEDG